MAEAAGRSAGRSSSAWLAGHGRRVCGDQHRDGCRVPVVRGADRAAPAAQSDRLAVPGLRYRPLTTAATVPIGRYGVQHGWPDSLLRALVTVYQVAWPFGIGRAWRWRCNLFPTGQPVSPRWRPLLWLTSSSAGCCSPLVGHRIVPVELGGVASRVCRTGPTGLAAWSPARSSSPWSLAAIASLIVRYVRGDDRDPPAARCGSSSPWSPCSRSTGSAGSSRISMAASAAARRAASRSR